MNEWPLPGQLIEAGNGMAMILFLAMGISATFYMVRHLLRLARSRKLFAVSLGDLFRAAYPELKGALSIATLTYGLFVRTGDVWLIRHIENHGGKPGPFLAAAATPVLIASTIPIVWGAVCWLRTVMPLGVASWAWWVLALYAIGFGVWMAL